MIKLIIKSIIKEILKSIIYDKYNHISILIGLIMGLIYGYKNNHILIICLFFSLKMGLIFLIHSLLAIIFFNL